MQRILTNIREYILYVWIVFSSILSALWLIVRRKRLK